MTKRLALMLACLALGLAACGGDDDSGGQAAGGGETGGGGTSVALENIRFNPNHLTVKAGETIRFTDKESVPHDVHKTAGPGPDFASGDAGGMQQGDTFELTLDKPGTYKYVCELHQPGMAGTITVK